MYGEATVSRDKPKIEELWEPIIKTWFTEGKDDLRITVIKVTPRTAATEVGLHAVRSSRCARVGLASQPVHRPRFGAWAV